MQKALGLWVFLAMRLCWVDPSIAVDVYQSKLSKNKVMVRVSDDEARAIVKNSKYSWEIARIVTGEMLLLVGVPESITGKVAAAAVATVLVGRYNRDILRSAREYKQGSTLGYYVNLEGIRRLWAASAVGDPLIPGTQASNALLDVINELANDSKRRR